LYKDVLNVNSYIYIYIYIYILCLLKSIWIWFLNNDKVVNFSFWFFYKRHTFWNILLCKRGVYIFFNIGSYYEHNKWFSMEKKKEKNMNPFLIYLQEKKTLEHGT